MRLCTRLLRPAPNQNIKSPKLWQDPILGYFETHGKTEFKVGEQYNLTDDEKKAVLWRYRVKEILKKEFLRRDYNPEKFKYKEGVVMDPAMFRWYSSEMTQTEYFRATPKSVFLYAFGLYLLVLIYSRVVINISAKSDKKCLEGEKLWWDRQDVRYLQWSGSGHMAPTWRD